jgi:hypothetical protein
LVGVKAEDIVARVEAARDAPLSERVDVYEAARAELEAMLARAVPR